MDWQASSSRLLAGEHVAHIMQVTCSHCPGTTFSGAHHVADVRVVGAVEHVYNTTQSQSHAWELHGAQHIVQDGCASQHGQWAMLHVGGIGGPADLEADDAAGDSADGHVLPVLCGIPQQAERPHLDLRMVSSFTSLNNVEDEVHAGDYAQESGYWLCSSHSHIV